MIIIELVKDAVTLPTNRKNPVTPEIKVYATWPQGKYSYMNWAYLSHLSVEYYTKQLADISYGFLSLSTNYKNQN